MTALEEQNEGPDAVIPWAPRLIMTGRIFRLPVQAAADVSPDLRADGFEVVDRRWAARDEAHFYYLRSPKQPGDYDISVGAGKTESKVTVQVRSLGDLRQPFEYNGAWWPRRWPLGKSWHSTKGRQTLQETPVSAVNEKTLDWWTSQDDVTLWRQLPPAEFARAHYVNVHQGCPHCGTAIFARHGGFYPWKHNHVPYDLKSECPNCGSVFPSNDLAANDFSSGDLVDDGFGYFDAEGHVYLFAAVCHRDLVSDYTSPVQALTARLRSGNFDAGIARQLGLLLLRWSAEEIYVAAAPPFRHGPSQEVEKAWDWGQPDWASQEDPIAALYRKGSLRYAIDIPGVGDALALAYDTIWPFVRSDDELVERARSLGLDLDGPQDAADLIEESLASLMQCSIDGAGLSNKPRISEGVLTVLRCLDRPDAGDVMEWLYDLGPDRLRVFATNNFTPDGVPPEASGGYNNTHTCGLFSLEYQLRELRQLWPDAYPLSLFPSQMADPRVGRILLAPYEIAMLGKLPFHFGDGGSSGVQGKLGDDVFLDPLNRRTLDRAVEYLEDSPAADIRDASLKKKHRRLGNTVQDGVGIAILRTGERPERAAAGIVYGDAPWHRHMDLLDVQLYAFDHPFLSDLGYPQSWAHVENWEGNWATHNSVWAVVPDVKPLGLPFDTPWHYLKALAGRGRLVRTLFADGGVQVVEVEARRWAFDAERLRWFDPGVRYRRLVALVETDGEGVALIDLARISGGSEHWRICRGLEGSFDIDGDSPSLLPGTLAGAHVSRGDTGAIDHPDHGGLAWMDDVAALGEAATWRSAWSSSRDPGVSLDLHQLNTTPGTEVFTARATAVMGTPEESKYRYQPVAWKRRPAPESSSSTTTCIDLLFEPRTGEATVARAEAIGVDEGDSTASGVLLETRGGRRICLYWAPGGGSPDSETRFADGTVLEGSLAVVEGIRAIGVGACRLDQGGKRFSFPHPRQQGTVVALDRGACTVEIEGITRLAPGDRIVVNPAGRGHTYRIEEVTELGGGRHRLRLDVTSVLGRARIASADAVALELDFYIITRTGNLHQTRLEREADGAWQVIEEAVNADAYSTLLHLDHPLAPDAAAGEWVAAVDYVVGDPVLLEAVNHGAQRP